jgi:hypothetical protein
MIMNIIGGNGSNGGNGGYSGGHDFGRAAYDAETERLKKDLERKMVSSTAFYFLVWVEIVEVSNPVGSLHVIPPLPKPMCYTIFTPNLQGIKKK